MQCDQVQSTNTQDVTTEVDHSQNPEPISTEVPNAQVPNAQVEDATQSSNTLPAQMMAVLKSLPPEEQEKVTRELLAALVKGKDNVDRFKKGDEARPAE